MGKFKPVHGLDAKVARKIAAAAVDDVAREVERRAREGAPGTKTWRERGDGRTRHTHVEADGQTVPVNLRYRLTTTDYDKGEGRGERNPAMAASNTPVGDTWLHWDPGTHAEQHENYSDNLHIAYGNTAGCRCFSELNPEGLSKELRRDDAVADGAKVRARVHLTAPYAIQAERGDHYLVGNVAGERFAEGTHFMENAAKDTARRRSTSG